MSKIQASIVLAVTAFWVVVIGLLMFAAVKASANTTILEPAASHFPYQQWVDESNVPTPEGSLSVVEDYSGCVEPVLGCTDGSTTIWILAPVARKFTFFHELGHVFAFQHPDLAPFVSERFANSYSLCASLPHIVAEWNYSNDSGMRGSRIQKICALIRHEN